LGRALLLVRVREDDRAVLGAEVVPLAVQRRRVVRLPEDVQQSRISDDGWIERDLNHFRMARLVSANTGSKFGYFLQFRSLKGSVSFAQH